MAPSQILRFFLCFQKALMAEINVFKLLMTDCINFSVGLNTPQGLKF